ncbi:MAG: DUF1643 domain-containing protein [Halioglobus sp.]
MTKTYLHRPNITIKAKFSSEKVPLFRYRLEATKAGASAQAKTVCAIMQNPSYAGVEVADRSAQVLERVVFEKGYKEFRGVERLIIVNQFAFIQTNEFLGKDEQIGKENNRQLAKAIEEADIILIAWGKDNPYHERKNEILKIVKAMKSKLVLQTSRHPSRVIYEGFIQQYDA